MRTRFGTKIFVASAVSAAAALLVASFLLSWQTRQRQLDAIQTQMIVEARAIADQLPLDAPGPAALDLEADRAGALVVSRVTLVTGDGNVAGDSEQTVAELAALENHATRPEVVDARETGVGASRRYSTTVGADLLYVAVRVSHPVIRYVRLARPLTEIDQQLAAIRRATLLALALAVPVALLVSWALAAPLARRVRSIAAVANRYAAGDLARPAADYGADELGEVARALDRSVQQLGGRYEELSRNRARMEAILTGMIEGVLVVDLRGRLQIVNRAAQAMLQVQPSAIGRHYLEVIRHPDVSAQIAAALGGNESDGRELAFSRDPGRVFVARAAPVDAAGGGGAVLVLHDITDLRRADRIRRDFVANVSHELRTPLTAIRGYVEALLDEPDGTGAARRFLEIIARHTSRMERLVSDLLRLARLDARQEPLDAAPCAVQALLQAVVADLEPSMAARRQRVRIDVAPEAREATLDSAKLHDIVRNLVENASNYSPEEAEIRVSASRADGALRLTVEDTGPGIPPEHLPRIFERFYRVDASRASGGTGLGLAIVKHLVELHGGTVAAANRPEGGALFTVTMPAA